MEEYNGQDAVSKINAWITEVSSYSNEQEEVRSDSGVGEEAFLASVGLQPRGQTGSSAGCKSSVVSCSTDLPDGWRRIFVRRQAGRSAGKYDCYIYSPDGKKHRSKSELAAYLEKKGIEMDMNRFDFRIRNATTPSSSVVDTTPVVSSSKKAAASLLDHAKRKASKSASSTSIRKNDKTVTKNDENDESFIENAAKKQKLSSPAKSLTKSVTKSSPKFFVRMNFKQKVRGEKGDSSSEKNSVRNSDDKEGNKSVWKSFIDQDGNDDLEFGDNNEKIKSPNKKLSGKETLECKLQKTSKFMKNALSLLSGIAKPENTSFCRAHIATFWTKYNKYFDMKEGYMIKGGKVGENGTESGVHVRKVFDLSVVDSEGLVELVLWHHAYLSWTPPQSPFSLVEEKWYRDPWRVLITSLFYHQTSTSLPRRALVSFFHCCPSASTVTCNKLKIISSALRPYSIDESFVDTLYKFTVQLDLFSYVSIADRRITHTILDKATLSIHSLEGKWYRDPFQPSSEREKWKFYSI